MSIKRIVDICSALLLEDRYWACKWDVNGTEMGSLLCLKTSAVPLYNV